MDQADLSQWMTQLDLGKDKATVEDDVAQVDKKSGPAENTTVDVKRDAEDKDDIPASAEECVKRTLVLIDFNGMLVFKDKHREGKGSPLAFFEGGTGRGRARFYVRPGAMELIARLASDSRCHYALYTSMQRHNIIGFLPLFDSVQRSKSATFEPFMCEKASITTPSTLAGTVKFVFDQDYNSPDPQPGDPYAFKRDLNKVWKARGIADEGFGPLNTLLVEGEAFKARDHKDNLLNPTEFTLEHVLRPTCDKELEKLGRVLDDIFARMQQPGASIPNILRSIKN